VDLKDLVRTARRRWLTIAAFVVLALLAAGVISAKATPEYSSQARVFISNDITSSQDAYAASLYSAQRVKSYADLANSRGMMLKVIADLDLKITPEALAGKVSASVVPDTVIILVNVTDVSPEGARQIAQSEADNLARYLTELETPEGKGTSAIKASVIDPADLNTAAVSPRTGLNLVVAGILGLIVGLGVALLRELFDNSVSDEHDVRDVTPAPTMARIGYDRRVSANPVIGSHENDAARSEAFRILRTNLQFLDIDTPVKSLVISSAVADEGKSLTTAELAVVVAQTGQRVLVVDADLRRPRMAPLFGLSSDVGLTTALVGKIGVEECIQRHSQTGVHVLASGPLPPNPSEILQTKAAQQLLEKLTGMFDLVLIDAPPLLPVADAAILTRSVTGAILVVRSGKTTKDQLRQAAQRLEAVGGQLLGITLNMTSRRSADYAYGVYEE
jgi:capsular exopolysaccharide synthesis family protein